jgi:hypothetical protein
MLSVGMAVSLVTARSVGRDRATALISIKWAAAP